MKTNSAFYVPVLESPHHTQNVPRKPAAAAGIITIGNEATVFRPIQRALRATDWPIVHAGDLDSALGYLRANTAAVAVIEVEEDWRDALSRVRNLPDAPQAVLLTAQDLSVEDVIRMGGQDVIRRPMSDAGLLWTIATAWHHWMKQRENASEGERCSGA